MPIRSSELSLPSSFSLPASSHAEEDTDSNGDDGSEEDNFDSESCDSSSDNEVWFNASHIVSQNVALRWERKNMALTVMTLATESFGEIWCYNLKILR